MMNEITNENENSLIEILPPEVVDQIAAGEVVDRPAHLVKELVENSIDAQATEISVDFSNGGRFVKVTDNGIGISRIDLPKAFLRFATSKIKKSEDIWRLSSFGFRGEALASISSVSKVTVFTSQNSKGEGFRISNNFGKISELESVSRTRGCTIIIEELFQNVPARLKFMKSEVAESSQIKHTLKSLALANPQVEFRVLQNGKLLYYWPKTSLKERIESVLEVKSLYEGSSTRGAIKVHSFFSDPNLVSRVSKNIWLYAQSRPIQDRSIQAAVMEAYRNLLMHGEYPYAVCFIETNPSDIDVNIHPTKSQVKFVNPQDAFRAVQASIREVLVKAPWLNSESKENKTFSFIEESKELEVSMDLEESKDKKVGVNPQPMNLTFEDEAFQRTQYQQKTNYEAKKSNQLDFSLSEVEKNRIDYKIKNYNDIFISKNENTQNDENDELAVIEENDAEKYDTKQIHQEEKTQVINDFKKESQIRKPFIRHWSLLQVIGQAGLTYLVCQSEKGIVLIDQHAAHERIAFERLMNSWKGNKIPIQQFLFPLPLEMSEEKIEALWNRKDDFLKLGIEIEVLGPTTIGVKSAPALIKNKVLLDEILRFANQLLELGEADLMEQVIADICARMACHSVMRAGQSLSLAEMQKLLEEMDEFPLSSFCPHGRPVSIHYNWPEIEKDFGRR